MIIRYGYVEITEWYSQQPQHNKVMVWIKIPETHGSSITGDLTANWCNTGYCPIISVTNKSRSNVYSINDLFHSWNLRNRWNQIGTITSCDRQAVTPTVFDGYFYSLHTGVDTDKHRLNIDIQCTNTNTKYNKEHNNIYPPPRPPPPHTYTHTHN